MQSGIISLNLPRDGQIPVSVICPMFNEGEKIRENLSKLFDALHHLPYPWELIYFLEVQNCLIK
jgi:hypothetical protein